MTGQLGVVGAREVNDILGLLPDLEVVADSSIALPQLFILALGFEDRAPSIARCLRTAANDGEKIRRSCLLGVYDTNPLDNERNRGPIYEAVSEFADHIVTVNADRPNDVSVAIRREVSVLFGGTRIEVAFDISAASQNYILSVMSGLSLVSEKINLTILYTEAAEYFPKKSKFDDDVGALIEDAVILGDRNVHLEYGVQDVEGNELYAGIFEEGHPNYVIAIPTFRMARIMRCLNAIGEQVAGSPIDNVFWILGRPPALENSWRADYLLSIVETMIARASGAVGEECRLSGENSVFCSTLDYKDVLAEILKRSDTLIDMNVTVINMGSKMQAIGAALALLSRQEMAVTSARPTEYNAAFYSQGEGCKWRLRFAAFDYILARLGEVSALTYSTEQS
jgi:hypothetical protein